MAVITRRRFVQAGACVVSVPSFLLACGSTPAKRAAIAPATSPAVPHDPFLAWFGVDEAMLRRVLAELTRRGADDAELYFQHTRSNWIGYEDGIVNQAYASVDLGVGLRVVIDGQVGYAYTEDLGEAAMTSAARAASAIARGNAVVPPQSFTPVQHRQLYEVEVPWSDVGVDQKLPLVRRAAELAHARDPSVEKISVGWSDADEHVLIADLRGNLVTDRRPSAGLSLYVTARRGKAVQSNGSSLRGRHALAAYDDERLQKLAKEAVDRTLVLFAARKPPSGELPVVLAAGDSGILLHEAIGHGMEADFNRKGVSLFADRLGKPVAPDFVTIVDDGQIGEQNGGLAVDDEGTPTERTVLVERGVLTNYLHDHISAKHYARKSSTGSARRESFRYPPMPRMRCTFMENGPHTREEIIASVQRGIVAETFTNGEVDIGGGDFTFYVKNGWLIERGKITAPIRDCNIIGNGPEALQRVTMAANDSRLDDSGGTCGKDGQSVPVSLGLPTVLVSRLTVGGSDV
ncbi:MAG TPA: TldD/PmbA family protein [Nannocystaceae bacterium]|nr:TldD/PmbA family protein [Nannocystaceae bacterium]